MSRRSSFLLKEKAFAFLVQQPAPKLIQYHIRDWIQVKKKDKKDSFCWILLGFPLHTRPAGSSELDYRPIRLKQLWGSISLDCYSQNTIRLIAALFYYREEREHKDLLFILITVKTAMPDFFLFWFDYLLFLLLAQLPWLGLPVLLWIKMARVGTIVLLLILEDKLSAFHHWVQC